MGSRLENNSTATRKRIEKHTFDNEEGEEYQGSKFGGFTDYFRRKKIKLQNLDAEKRSLSTDNPPIFRNIVAHVNGYTQPSLNDLHNLIVSYGGGFSQYLDGKTSVTHIIASSLTPKKTIEFRRYRIVKPAWVVDSVNAGKLLPWDAYRVVDEGVGQKVLQLDNGKVFSQISNQPKGYRDQSDASWYTNQLFKSTQNTAESAASAQKHVEDKQLLRGSDVLTSSPDPLSLDADKQAFPEKGADDIEDGAPEDEIETVQEQHSLRQKEPSDDVSPDRMTHESFDEEILDEDLNIPTQDLISAPVLTTPSKATHSSESTKTPNSGAKRELTAEEHNTILLADPRLRKSTVVNPDFLEQYYRESRLHHLSTWKADLKSQLQALTVEKSSSQQARPKRQAGARRYIMHVDFDSFFVAVSLKKCPEFTDKPAVVAHGAGPGSEIASCNYPARKFGVKNGMWMKKALELCSDLKVLPYDFPGYEAASRLFYEAILATGGIVQSVSVDEALIDITTLCLPAGGTNGVGVREGSVWREEAKADELGQKLREEVKERTGCAVSVGIGGNILLAKLALRKAKPAGQHQVKPDEVLDFIAGLEVQDLPGVAYSIGGRLEEIGIKYVRDIRDTSKEKLVGVLGPKTGEKLWNYARGIDKTEVGEQVIRKSVSAEVNWGVRFENVEQAEEFIDSLCGELSKRLLKERVRGRQLTMKIMRRAADAPMDPPKNLGHGKCDTFNKSTILGVATNTHAVLAKEATSILRGYGFSPGELRGLGVQMTKLEPIKAVAGGDTDGSQRRLQFRTNPSSKEDQQKDEDPIKDDIVTPKKAKPSHFLIDPPAALMQGNESPSRKLLNTLGTQFILPTQVDPEVFAQLPEDIRSKLTGKLQQSIESKPTNAVKTSFSDMPTHSQLDPDILNSLPEDLRAEVLAEYERSSKPRGQSLLPQSPRKLRTLPPSRTLPSIRGKRGGSGFLSRLKGTTRSDTPTLTQTNFLTTTSRAGSHEPSGAESDAETLDPEFLAALPDDIRREILENARRAQLKRTAGLEMSRRRGAPPQRVKADASVEQNAKGERTVKLPPRPARPTFTTQKLSTQPELREAMGAWIGEFRVEGPYAEDVDALGRYLGNVVREEGNMGKAVGVIRWMGWLIRGGGGGGGVDEDEGRLSAKWEKALERTEGIVRDAVRARGLGEVDFNE